MKVQSIPKSQKIQRILILLAMIVLGALLVLVGSIGYEEGRPFGEFVANAQLIVGSVLMAFSFAALVR